MSILVLCGIGAFASRDAFVWFLSCNIAVYALLSLVLAWLLYRSASALDAYGDRLRHPDTAPRERIGDEALWSSSHT